jgi:hypothetical protein
MTLLQGVIIHSIQTLSKRTIEALSDYSSVTYSLCSFSAPENEIPPGWGYFFIPLDDLASVTYSLCSFSVPEGQLPSEWGYYFLSAQDLASVTYSLCSFSVPPEEIETQYPLDTLQINGLQTSIYGVSSEASSLLSIGATRQPSFTFWEVLTSPASNFKIIPTYKNSLNCWLSGGEPWYDASTQPLSARMVVGIDGKTYRTTTVALKPYESPLDIPNLQLWLDASDKNTVNVQDNRVSQWIDKSPNALTATQPVINNQTTYLSAEVNNLNVLNFDGTDDFLNLSSPIPLSGNYSHFFVYRRPSNTSTNINSVSLGRNTNNSSTPFLHFQNNYMYGGTQYNNRVIPVSGATYIIGTLKDTSLFLDTTRESAYPTPWGVSNPSFADVVGIYRGGEEKHNGAMGEIIHTSARLPDEELRLVNQRLIDKWKVP